MPISRKKACEPCRVAKARCSLETVCSRCFNRGLTCEYSRGPSRVGPYTRPHLSESDGRLSLATPTVHAEPLSSLFSSSDLGIPFLDFGARDFLHEDTPTIDNLQLAHWNLYQANGSEGISLDRVARNSNEIEARPALTVDSPLYGARSSPTLNGLPTFMLPSDPTEKSQSPDTQLNKHSAFGAEETAACVASATSPTQPHRSPSPMKEGEMSADIGDDTEVVVKGRPYERFQALRRGASTQQLLMAKTLIGQVENFPRMLIRGSRLPPFIYPQCVLNSRLCHQCIAENGSHQCLPEPLANCAAWAQLYYSRNPDNAQFVWKTMYNEQKRLHEQFATFDTPTLLAAVQAVVMYTILVQAEDTDTIAQNELASMAVTLSEMAGALHFRSKYHIDILHNHNLSEKNWVIHESIRRTINLFYIIGILLIIRIGGPPKHAEGCGILDTPLPCGRDLWEPEATETFGLRLHRYKSRLVSNRGLIIEDLYNSLGPGKAGASDATDPLVQKDLGTWCESLDDLGTLVWMASILDQQPR